MCDTKWVHYAIEANGGGECVKTVIFFRNVNDLMDGRVDSAKNTSFIWDSEHAVLTVKTGKRTRVVPYHCIMEIVFSDN